MVGKAVVKRRFIRIEEIEQKTSFTKGDILELIENGELSLSAMVNSEKMGAIHTKDGTRYVYGVFRYNGIVGLTNEASKWFAESDKNRSVSIVLIKQPEKISGWGTVEEHFGKVEHDNTPYFPVKMKKPRRNVWAFPRLAVGKSGLQMFSNMTVILTKAAGTYDKNPQGIVEDQKDYFRSGKLRVSPDDLRIDLEELSRFIEDDNNLGALSKASTKASVSLNVETHPIKQIIERVLVQNSGSNSREIWNLVRRDIESDSKQFDIDNVIFEITQDDLSYFGRE
ncbi:hypothetical protein R3X26_13125, partial [Vibrio sp. TH_r3]|uniref:hypothetical protein n=1 Tax=Vibrio sp. TH_r3 TaxID=3082084 RepID=UPI0029532695